MGRLVSKNEFAKLTGKSPTWVNQWVREGLPIHQAGKRVQIETEEGINWLIEQATAKYRPSDDDTESRADWDRRLTRAKALDAEMNNAVRRGELCDMNQAEQAFCAALVTFRSQSDAIGGRLAGTLAMMDDPAQIRAAILVETRRCCNAAADCLDSIYTAGTKRLTHDPE